MTIQERITGDITSAMKNKDELKLSTLRLVLSSLKNKRIELGRELTDEDATAVLKTMKKQFLDALSDFEKAGREDLISKQKGENAILDEYLPKALGEEELERIVTEAVQASGASGQGDFGKAMGAAVKAVEGRADGNTIRAIVQRLLG
jgi:uncharacterized protein